MNELGPQTRALLEAAGSIDPSPADRARVRAAIAAALVAGTASASVSAASAKATGAALGAGKTLSIVVASGLVVAALVGGGQQTELRATRPPTPSASAQPSSEPAPIERTIEEPPTAERLKPHRERSRVKKPVEDSEFVFSESPLIDGPSIIEQLELLKKAQIAIREGRNETALETLETHEARFPDSALLPEQIVLRARALCALGRTREARRWADRLLDHFPTAPQARSIRSSCAFDDDRGAM